MAEYGLSDSCTAVSDLAKCGLARYAPPISYVKWIIHFTCMACKAYLITSDFENNDWGIIDAFPLIMRRQ